MKTNSSRGFTLIELMIVVAIVAILVGLAYPAYTSSIAKGRRAQARTALAELLQQQERYLTQRNVYFAFTNTSGVTNPVNVPFKTFAGDNVANASYWLSADACPDGVGGTLALADCVRVIATPIRADAAAGALRMTSTGTKDCTGTNSEVCWQ